MKKADTLDLSVMDDPVYSIGFVYFWQNTWQQQFVVLLSQCADGNAETVETKQNLNSEIKA